MCGMQYAVCGKRYAICGKRYVVCGMRYEVCGMWYAVCGMRYAVCGVRYAVRGTPQAGHRAGRERMPVVQAGQPVTCVMPPKTANKLASAQKAAVCIQRGHGLAPAGHGTSCRATEGGREVLMDLVAKRWPCFQGAHLPGNRGGGIR